MMDTKWTPQHIDLHICTHSILNYERIDYSFENKFDFTMDKSPLAVENLKIGATSLLHCRHKHMK